MKLIELHLLQSFPVTCLNRDDVGAPKTVTFGGVNRARVSSQCWKRAIRELAMQNAPGLFAGKRGHYHAEALEKKLIELGVEQERAQELALKTINAYGKEGKKAGQSSVALYLSPAEIEAVAAELKSELDNSSKDATTKKQENAIDTKAVSKAIRNISGHDIADIALFGRMVASDHSLMLEGAGMFSHAISTHASASEVDFFSAVDETKPFDDSGAGHIGTLEMNSACYYRYIGINVDLLFDAAHLGDFNPEERRTVLNVFMRAVVEAIPGARKNSMFGFTRPQFAWGIVRKGQPLSLVNAFEVPVRPGKTVGYVQPSIDALLKHWESLNKEYELDREDFHQFTLGEELPLGKWADDIISSAVEG